MIQYSEACKIMRDLGATFEWPSESLKLEDAIGRITSKAVLALDFHPRFSNSAMDGYTLRSSSTAGASINTPVVFDIAGTQFAGSNPDSDRMQSNSQTNAKIAIEIMTGAPLPDGGFDSVIPVEHILKLGENQIAITQEIVAGYHVRPRGEDFNPATTLCPKGKVLDHKTLMLLAAGGISQIDVYKKIPATIIATGNEIVDFRDKHLGDSDVRNVTTLYLKTALKDFLNFSQCHTLKDSPDDFKNTVLNAFASGVEVIITTGGVSMGRADFVKDALLDLGADILFHKVAIKPGKPILLSTLLYNGRKKIILSSPGNPLSTIVATQCFLKVILKSSLLNSSHQPRSTNSNSHLQSPTPDVYLQRRNLLSQNLSAFKERVSTSYKEPDDLCCNGMIHNNPPVKDPTEDKASGNKTNENKTSENKILLKNASQVKLEQESMLHRSQHRPARNQDFLFEKSFFFPLLKEVKKPKGLLCFFKAKTTRLGDQTFLEIMADQGSHRLASLAQTEGLVVLPEDIEVAEAGRMIEFIILD